MNANHEKMENGDTINPGLMQEYYCTYGGSWYAQGVISLPFPGSNSLYYIFNLDEYYFEWSDRDLLPFAPKHLFYSLIDMSLENGLGRVVQKNQVLIQDSFPRGNIQAARHANGSDWWLVVPQLHSNCYHIILVTDKGIGEPVLQCIGKSWNNADWQSQAVFSPDNNKYVRFNFWNGLNIFDFDNSTGRLSNPVIIKQIQEDTFNFAGAAISPNSRFLYLSTWEYVYQFDLTAQDIAASKILIAKWDGFQNPFPTIFYLMALAPDGKIYISSTSSTKNLHVIHYPDCPGLSCTLEQHGVTLPTYNFATIPNLPHYRNNPSDINCDTISSLSDQNSKIFQIVLHPNPVSDELKINFQDHAGQGMQYIRIFDSTGALHWQQEASYAYTQSITVSDWPAGVYILVVANNTGGQEIVKFQVIK